MSFRFDFDLSTDTKGNNQQSQDDQGADDGMRKKTKEKRSKNNKCHPFRLLLQSEYLSQDGLIERGGVVATKLSDNHDVLVVRQQDLATEEVAEGSSLKAELELKRTDILDGRYEGGLKIWESSIDLCSYISDPTFTQNILKYQTVLELGCGHALPAIAFLLEHRKRKTDMMEGPGATVTLVDYNDFVLREVTIPNIFLNCGKEIWERRQQYEIVLGAGDWLDMESAFQGHPELAADARFDLILAAETTYSLRTAQETALLVSRHLKPIHGIALLAMKRYYFGVGGGTSAFLSALSNQGSDVVVNGSSYRLEPTTVDVVDDGSNNIREILQVKLVPSVPQADNARGAGMCP